jgi:hypothetical protein
VVATAAPANSDHANEYDYEDEAEPAPAPVAPAAGRGRLSLINTRGQRGPSPLIGSRGTAVKQQTTAKPVEPPPELVICNLHDNSRTIIIITLLLKLNCLEVNKMLKQ